MYTHFIQSLTSYVGLEGCICCAFYGAYVTVVDLSVYIFVRLVTRGALCPVSLPV